MAQARRGSKRQGGRGNGRQGGQGNGRQGGRGQGRGSFVRTETRVWHDPNLKAELAAGGADIPTSAPAVDASALAAEAPSKRVGRIVAGPKPVVDPVELERQRLLARLLAAVGRPSISAAVDDYLARSFELPRTQSVWLQVLEHRDETKVALALEALHALLDEPTTDRRALASSRPSDRPVALERRAVLETRLRRIEEISGDPENRRAATELLRRIQGGGVHGQDGTGETGRRGVDATS